MKTKGFNLLSWAALSLVLVLLDQYTKLLAVAHLKGKTPFVILDGVFELLYSENRGAAFGMMQGKQGFFFLIGAVVLAAAIYVMWRMPGWSCLRYTGLRICTILISYRKFHRPRQTGLCGRFFILQADRFPDL